MDFLKKIIVIAALLFGVYLLAKKFIFPTVDPFMKQKVHFTNY